MIFDIKTIEDDPFLAEMCREVTELAEQKDKLYAASEADPANIRARLVYDATVIHWARSTNKYHNAIKAVLGL
jgi:hypothetical protein